MCNFLKNWAPGTRLLKNRNVLTKRTYFINGIIIINIIYAFFMDPSATATLQPLSRPVSISSSWIHLPQQHSSHSRVQCLYLLHGSICHSNTPATLASSVFIFFMDPSATATLQPLLSSVYIFVIRTKTNAAKVCVDCFIHVTSGQ